MAMDALQLLPFHVERLTAEDIQCLAQAQDADWFSQLSSLQPEVAVREILRILEEPSSGTGFLQRAGWLYCWLMSRQKIGPWLLFRFGASVLQADCFVLLDNVLRALRSIGRPGYLSMRKEQNTFYSCIITKRSNSTTRKYDLAFVVLWGGQRFAATYIMNEQQRNILTCLHIALSGESVELLEGHHADLDATFRAGRRYQDIGGPTLLRLDRDPRVAARFFPNGQRREQAEDQL
ncbi:hypothetical protein MTO96_033762 [Rhipicephalus appendiculatus]